MKRRTYAEARLPEVAYMRAREAGYGPVKAYRAAMEALELPTYLAIAFLKGVGSDGWPTQVEYAEWLGVSYRSAQRQWAHYREIFGPDADPEELARRLALEFGRRLAEGDRGNPTVGLTAPASLLPA